MDYGTYSFQGGEPDQQVKEIIALAGALYVPHDMYQDEETISFDYGLNYDWSKPTVKVSIHISNSGLDPKLIWFMKTLKNLATC